MIKYSLRLNAIKNLVPKNSMVLDIGCDHGYLAKMLIDEGIAKYVMESDISKPSLDKAIRLLNEEKYKNKVQFKLSDGLEGIREYQFDTLVIAGMGEETIIEILQNNISISRTFLKIILQAMGNNERIRKFLVENSFSIEKELFLIEDGKYYFISSVKNTPDIQYKTYSFPKKLDTSSLADYKKYLNDSYCKYSLIYKKILDNEAKKKEANKISTKLKGIQDEIIRLEDTYGK